MIYIANEKKAEYVFCREKWWESVISDVFTFLMTVCLLYVTKNYLGNSWLALFMMAVSCFSLLHKRKKIVSKKEFMEIIKKELRDASED